MDALARAAADRPLLREPGAMASTPASSATRAAAATKPAPACRPVLSGALIVCSGLREEMRHTLRQRVLAMQGTWRDEITDDTTVLIMERAGSEKHRRAAEMRRRGHPIQIVKPQWIDEIYARSQRERFDPFVSSRHYPVRPLEQLVITSTGFLEAAREEIEALVADLGATYSPSLTMQCSHLIAKHPSGPKYQFAVQHGILIVHIDWLRAAHKSDALPRECDYPASPRPDGVDSQGSASVFSEHSGTSSNRHPVAVLKQRERSHDASHRRSQTLPNVLDGGRAPTTREGSLPVDLTRRSRTPLQDSGLAAGDRGFKRHASMNQLEARTTLVPPVLKGIRCYVLAGSLNPRSITGITADPHIQPMVHQCEDLVRLMSGLLVSRPGDAGQIFVIPPATAASSRRPTLPAAPHDTPLTLPASHPIWSQVPPQARIVSVAWLFDVAEAREPLEVAPYQFQQATSSADPTASRHASPAAAAAAAAGSTAGAAGANSRSRSGTPSLPAASHTASGVDNGDLPVRLRAQAQAQRATREEAAQAYWNDVLTNVYAADAPVRTLDMTTPVTAAAASMPVASVPASAKPPVAASAASGAAAPAAAGASTATDAALRPRFLARCCFVIVGFSAEEIDGILRQEIEASGGRIVDNFTQCDTSPATPLFLLTPFVTTPPHVAAAAPSRVPGSLDPDVLCRRYDAPPHTRVVTEFWLERSLSDGVLHAPDAMTLFRPSPSLIRYDARFFAAARLSITGFGDVERDQIGQLAELLGAQFSERLCRSNTHLIMDGRPIRSGDAASITQWHANRKVQKAREWNVWITDVTWLYDTIAHGQGAPPDLTPYLVDPIQQSSYVAQQRSAAAAASGAASTSPATAVTAAAVAVEPPAMAHVVAPPPKTPLNILVTPVPSKEASPLDTSYARRINTAIQHIQSSHVVTPGPDSASAETITTTATTTTTTTVADGSGGGAADQAVDLSTVLAGVVLASSQRIAHRRQEIARFAQAMGAEYVAKLSPRVTHYIHQSTNRAEVFRDFRLAMERQREGKAWIVSPFWLQACFESGFKVDPRNYPHTYRPDRAVAMINTPAPIAAGVSTVVTPANVTMPVASVPATVAPAPAPSIITPMLRDAVMVVRETPAPTSAGLRESPPAGDLVDMAATRLDPLHRHAADAPIATPSRPSPERRRPHDAKLNGSSRPRMDVAEEEDEATTASHVQNYAEAVRRLLQNKAKQRNDSVDPLQTPPARSVMGRLAAAAAAAPRADAASAMADGTVTMNERSAAAAVSDLTVSGRDDVDPTRAGVAILGNHFDFDNLTQDALHADGPSGSHASGAGGLRGAHANGSSASHRRSALLHAHSSTTGATTGAAVSSVSAVVEHTIIYDDPDGRREKRKLLKCLGSATYADAADERLKRLRSDGGGSDGDDGDGSSPRRGSAAAGAAASDALNGAASDAVPSAAGTAATYAHTPKVCHILVSGIKLGPRQEIAGMVRRLAGTMLESRLWAPQCTHLVTEKPCLYAEKTLAACAAGVWHLKVSWITASSRAGRFLPEDEHVWQPDDTKDPDEARVIAAMRQWRSYLGVQARRGSPGAFHGWRVVFYGPKSRYDVYRRVLRAGNAVPILLPVLADAAPLTKLEADDDPATTTSADGVTTATSMMALLRLRVTHLMFDPRDLATLDPVLPQLVKQGVTFGSHSYVKDYLHAPPEKPMATPTIDAMIQQRCAALASAARAS